MGKGITYVAGRYDHRGFRLVGRVDGGPFIRIDTYVGYDEMGRTMGEIRKDCILHAKELAEFHNAKYGGVKRWRAK